MDDLFKKFDIYKNQNEDDKINYIRELSEHSKQNIITNVLENTNVNSEEILQKNIIDDETNPKYINSFFEDYDSIITHKKRREVSEKITEDFINNVIEEEQNNQQEYQSENSKTIFLDEMNNNDDNEELITMDQLEELNTSDDFYYDKKARRKIHRNKKKNYGSFIYNHNIHQLKNYNHINKKPSTNIFVDTSSGSEAYDEEYSISEEVFKEKKKALKDNKVFYNVLAEYIDSFPEMFQKLEINKSIQNNNLEVNENLEEDKNTGENLEEYLSGSESEEEIETEYIDAMIEHEYQKCLGVLDLVLKYADNKNITYKKDYLTEKLRGFSIVMKPYCLHYHNFIGYLKIKDGKLELVTGTFIKYCENNNRLLISKDFKFMFTINPVRLLFKKIRIEDITEWIYDA